eukprot:808508-Rhodomonas_salina.2
MGHRYNHILAMGLQDKRKQLDGPREDPRKLQTQEQVHVDTCNHTTSQQPNTVPDLILWHRPVSMDSDVYANGNADICGVRRQMQARQAMEKYFATGHLFYLPARKRSQD